MTRGIQIAGVLGLATAVWWASHPLTLTIAEENQPQKATKSTPIGDALQNALKPGTQKILAFPGTTAPGAKGLVQQPLWEFRGLRKNIQLAFVLDATNSMSRDIESLKSCLGDVINQIKDQVTEVRNPAEVKVWIAVVVYRDWWQLTKTSPTPAQEIRVRFQGADEEDQEVLLKRRESPVEILTGRPGSYFIDFDSGLRDLKDRLQGISLEAGHPGDEEQVDVGIGTALQELDWMKGDKISRVLVVAGDSPPWKEEYLDWSKNPAFWTFWEKKEVKPQPLRMYSTRKLVELAQNQDVSVVALGCDKSERITQADRERMGRMREFFSSLTQQTAGKFLDLSDPDVKGRLQRAVHSEGETLQELRRITAAELESVSARQEYPTARLAVLPPLEKVDYRLSYDDDAYHVASLLTKRLQDLDPLLAVGGDQVRRAWLRLSPDGAVTPKLRAALAAELNASFVIWGALHPSDGRISLEFNVSGSNGEILTEGETARADLLTVVEKAWKGLLVTAEKHSQAEPFTRAFSRLAITTDFAQTPEALRELLKGYTKLEEATQFAINDTDSQRLNEEAMLALQNVLRSEPNSVFAQLLLASCQINLNQSNTAKDTLIEARRLAESLPQDDPLRLEVEADHAWYVKSDAASAIQAYQRILKSTEGRYPRVALRARWTLAGYYLSSLPQIAEAIPNVVERLDLAREQILAILLNWRETPEARFYEQYVQPSLPARSKSNGPVRIVETEHRIAVPLARPRTLVGGLSPR